MEIEQRAHDQFNYLASPELFSTAASTTNRTAHVYERVDPAQPDARAPMGSCTPADSGPWLGPTK
jgi:hypothetical protein